MSVSSSNKFEAEGTESQPMELIQTVEAMELRLHRLEQAVASLQNHSENFDRTSEEPANNSIDEKTTEKSAVANESERTNTLHTEEKRSTPAPAPEPKLIKTMKQSWLFWDIWTEFVAIIRMFFDVRYHVGWFARLTVLVGIPVILTSQWWLPVPSLFGLGAILDKVFNLLIAFFTFKVLNREAQRYRQWKLESRKTTRL